MRATPKMDIPGITRTLDHMTLPLAELGLVARLHVDLQRVASAVCRPATPVR